MIISVKNISKVYNGNTVLKNINFNIEDQDRVGLIGINGSGKTTLLRLITGMEQHDVQERPEEETISVSKGKTIGFLQQNAGLEPGNTIWQEMQRAFDGLIDIQNKMRAIESEMAGGTHTTDLTEEYGRLSGYFEAHEGYQIDVKIRTVLNGMNFPSERDDTIVERLSGGEKTRLALCKLLLESPDLLILDEPTNHLDFSSILWLEDYLKSWRGALLIVSHDRYFLDRLCTSIAEVEVGRLTRYKGNYSAFVLQKEMAVVRQWKEYEMQQEEIAKLQEYVDKNLVRASTTVMAQSRRRQLEKMERIEKPLSAPKNAKIRFGFEVQPPQEVLVVEGLELAVGRGPDRRLLSSNLTFTVRRGEKIALLGPNGVGKTTLLRVLIGRLDKSKGYFEWARNVKVSYFDQENAQLGAGHTVMEELHRRYPSMSDLEVRSALGAVRLTGENVYKSVDVISGGERAKLCFAIMMQETGNVLILDEPTNHLDIATREVLEEALVAYEGTMIFVSHDRYFVEKVANRVIELSADGLESYKGAFETYLESKRLREKAAEQVHEVVSNEKNISSNNNNIGSSYRSKEQRAADVKRRQYLKALEEEIEDLQSDCSLLQDKMILPEICSDYQEMDRLCAELEDIKNLVAEKTDEWLLLSEENN